MIIYLIIIDRYLIEDNVLSNMFRSTSLYRPIKELDSILNNPLKTHFSHNLPNKTSLNL